MYSRSTRNNRRNGVSYQTSNTDRSSKEAGSADMNTNGEKNEKNNNTLPDPPPNYRGMIYEQGNMHDMYAEGISRLAGNDESYEEYGENARRRQNSRNLSGRGSLNMASELPDTSQRSGLHRLIDGLSDKNYGAEDILICAMIILMLNGGSEDDMLMVLVLLMLL